VNSRPYAACLVAASLTVGGVVLSGCSGDGDPPATSTSTSSTSSSSSMTTTPSTTTTSATTSPVKLPPEATKHTEKGAEAFVRFYIDQLNEAWTRPDSKRLPPLSDPDCIACKSLQETAVSLAQKREKYASNPVTVTKVVPVGKSPKGIQLVRLFMDQHKVNVLDSSGKVVLTDQAKELSRTVGVTWKGDSWLLFDMQ
jgi:hypothetical protein